MMKSLLDPDAKVVLSLEKVTTVTAETCPVRSCRMWAACRVDASLEYGPSGCPQVSQSRILLLTPSTVASRVDMSPSVWHAAIFSVRSSKACVS
jgi:hypothetical protein